MCILSFQKLFFKKHIKVRAICHCLFQFLICFEFQVVAYDHYLPKVNCFMHIILPVLAYFTLYCRVLCVCFTFD